MYFYYRLKSILSNELILALPVSVITAVIFFIVRLIIHKKQLGSNFKAVRKKAVLNEIIWVLFIFWTVLVFGGTLLPSGRDLTFLLDHSWKLSRLFSTPYFGRFFDMRFDISHMGLNIMMFVPIGLALPFILKKENFKKVVLTGLCMTVSIEFLQAFVNRETSLDDIICNTLGAAAGYGLYLLMRLIFPRFTEKCKVKVK